MSGQWDFELDKLSSVMHAERDGVAFRPKIGALNSAFRFESEIVQVIDAVSFGKLVGFVHNERFIFARHIVRKFSKNLLQLGNFLMVFSNVQDHADFWRIADKRSIAFVGFGDEPFSRSSDSVSDLALLFERHKTRARKNRRREFCVIQNMPDHTGHGAFTARTADADRFGAFRNFGEHFAAMHTGNVQFKCPF